MLAAWSGIASTVHKLADNMGSERQQQKQLEYSERKHFFPNFVTDATKASARTQIVRYKNVREGEGGVASGGTQLRIPGLL